ncbi:M18 family aminopeptidase [Paractinoplanes brasiliensis]|uniref:M18 family aminopeptidase n=1 Tax=Paractinoplanes brasiliensis TaxID=52695 RepID=A0A4R6JUG4_9ACTN|nr:M18 family aminopeptidase [Actinoplanes brasiliensis]TDO40350.1 aspartyl aminopeptidase [Actinoplanes brasiliensis]GID25416.1 M18 family aminopeptidase [Actinoplanes brasiliensis]
MDATAHIDDLAAFVSASPSSYHAAAEVARRLGEAGYETLDETADWTDAVRPGARLLIVRDGSVIALALPSAAGRGTPFRILGAHTDSPGFKLKPKPSTAAFGWWQAGVEVYGGPIVASWFDRELEFAGRVVHRDGTVHLVRTGPFARIPHLAIHLDRAVNESFAPDKQRELQPVWGAGGPGDADVVGHLARLAGIPDADLAGYDVVTVDSAGPARFGAGEKLFASARLDNLSSVHAGVTALLAAEPSDAIAVLAAFDHEEIGSESRSGAAGPFLADVLERVVTGLGGDRSDLARAIAGSWCLSSDAGHAVHPNRPERHDPVNRPVTGAGPLLKINANQRYMTDGPGAALWSRTCAAAGVPYQEFVSNNSVPCGSTIGPITAARIGIPTLDVGVPLLSMHSAREMCHVDDPAYLSGAIRVFLSAQE